ADDLLLFDNRLPGHGGRLGFGLRLAHVLDQEMRVTLFADGGIGAGRLQLQITALGAGHAGLILFLRRHSMHTPWVKYQRLNARLSSEAQGPWALRRRAGRPAVWARLCWD